MMLGLLLARAGVEVAVLEKHADFLRDFRGDTIHPSTLQLLQELGWLEKFLQLPHQSLKTIPVIFADRQLAGPDFSGLPIPYIVLMPQWEFLNFLQRKAKQYRGFHLHMSCEAVELLRHGEKICGVQANTPQGKLEIRAPLVIGADGRTSTVRELAGLEPDDLGAPIDVLWFRAEKGQSHASPSLGHFRDGRLMVTLDRGEYWQCGYIIAKGEFETIRAQGLAAFRQRVIQLVPYLTDGITALQDWDSVKLLTVQINRLPCWYRDGLLCIGDAAHAMSPAGGVGINLAIQDAVATANLLHNKLLQECVTTEDLQRVQRRREWPTRGTQAMQVFMHRNLLQPGVTPNDPPWAARLFLDWPLLRRLPARILGLGLRPEHVRSSTVLESTS